uniref:Uncharacterized protein n=1 Tax=Ixodes scapularis TaxID=6945 RepID=A0A4D5RYH8_IXOSC
MCIPVSLSLMVFCRIPTLPHACLACLAANEQNGRPGRYAQDTGSLKHKGSHFVETAQALLLVGSFFLLRCIVLFGIWSIKRGGET